MGEGDADGEEHTHESDGPTDHIEDFGLPKITTRH